MTSEATKSDNLKGRIVPRSEWPAKYLQPIAGDLSGLVSKPDVVSLITGKWFAVATEPRHEVLAKEEIAGQGLITYLPMEPRRERHGRGQVRTVDRPIIPTYLFVKCEPVADHWHRVTCSRGVHRVLADIGGKPVAVPEKAIEAIRLFETVQQERELARIKREDDEAAYQASLKAAQEVIAAGKKLKIVWHFTEGDRVRIKHGPFAGFYAQLESAPDAHARVDVMISAFGRIVSTEMSAFEIDRAQDVEET